MLESQMLMKILAICIKLRVVDRLHEKIPPTQAAYRQGRSTTEHLFAANVPTEKIVKSKHYPI